MVRNSPSDVSQVVSPWTPDPKRDFPHQPNESGEVKQQSAAVKRWEETRVLIIETRQHGGERPVYSDVRVAFGAMPST